MSNELKNFVCFYFVENAKEVIRSGSMNILERKDQRRKKAFFKSDVKEEEEKNDFENLSEDCVVLKVHWWNIRIIGGRHECPRIGLVVGEGRRILLKRAAIVELIHGIAPDRW